jgi:hypothetical protein
MMPPPSTNPASGQPVPPWQRCQPGKLTVRFDGRLTCHVCLRGFHKLGVHVRIAHGLDRAAYLARFELPPDTVLVSVAFHDRTSRTALENPLKAHPFGFRPGWTRKKDADIKIDGEPISG